jgi:hypothetical protein
VVLVEARDPMEWLSTLAEAEAFRLDYQNHAYFPDLLAEWAYRKGVALVRRIRVCGHLPVETSAACRPYLELSENPHLLRLSSTIPVSGLPRTDGLQALPS